jgi:hypothetical protein
MVYARNYLQKGKKKKRDGAVGKTGNIFSPVS